MNKITACIVFAVISVLALAWVNPVQAASLAPTSLQDDLDTSLADTRFNQYAPSTTLYLYTYDNSSIAGGEEQFKTWYKELYYHFIVQERFTDLPFNYIVSENGVLYSGRQGGYDVQASLKTDESVTAPGKVLVWVPLQSDSQALIKQQLQSIVDWYRISKAQTVQLSVVAASGNEPAKLSADKPVPYNGLRLSNGDLSQRGYKVEVSKIDYPRTTDQGVNFTVTATIDNKSDFPLYNKLPNQFFLATCSPHNKKSDYTESETWASASQVNSFKDPVVLPGGQTSIEFKMTNPLEPGKYSETFCAMIMPGTWFDQTKFTISFTSTDTGLKLLRVQVTDYDFVNVRGQPQFNGTELFKLNRGDVAIKDGAEENGWIKIRTRDGRKGWVLGRYLRSL